MRHFAIILLSFLLMPFAQSAEKQIYAHYMGCYPVASSATAHHRKEVSQKTKHDSSSYEQAMGGRILNWDLVPPGTKLTPEQSAELDIKRAIRGGIDGFAVDAWAGSEGAKRTLDTMFKVAEEKNLPFKLTICLDPNCLPKNDKEPGNKVQAYVDAINYVLKKHGTNPKLARRNGKPLFFGYHSRGIIRTPEFNKQPEGPEKWNRIAAAYKEVEKGVGTPVFFHFGMGAFFHQVPKQNRDYRAAANWAGENFPAVGAFLGTDFDVPMEEIAADVKSAGAEWSQPMWYQYSNRCGSLHVGNGFDILRRQWELARKTNSTLIQFITWNDYGEHTILAPGYSTGYSVLELNKYFIDWWKTGTAPIPEHDKLFVAFRRYPKDCRTYPFKTRRYTPGVLEVTSILTKPGKITLPNRNISYDAPAGLSFKQFPLGLGEVKAVLARDGKEIISLTAPEQVTDKPFREDNSMTCFSSEYTGNWNADFPGIKPFLYSENGDVDNDGLPNWFEMYWFGKFLDQATATVADPKADPDKDGLTNLQEYQAQSDPTKPEPVYQVGDVWDMKTVHTRKASFNPDIDFKETPVWHYLYKHGHPGKTARDGNYIPCPYSAPKTPYTGPMVHLSPHKQTSEYKYIHGWICRQQAADGHWQLLMRPRVQAMLVLGWRSPVNGTVSISGTVLPVKGKDGITMEIHRETTPLYKKVYQVSEGEDFKLTDIKVNKGEFIYFIADSSPGPDLSQLVIDKLKIELTKKDQ